MLEDLCLSILYYCCAQQPMGAKDGFTPALLAAHEGHRDCVQVLVDHKADVNQAVQGWSPLSEAQAKGRSAVVEILLAAGAK